ncbi:MAG: 3'(2'),5'-bisphosphate nucleotidase CysQ [Alphaproteobacteria bacterium]|nr:3'(2'),5'-bisphosphate nucleotidase CysQ [Alphaproteobacteria bacterium]
MDDDLIRNLCALVRKAGQRAVEMRTRDLLNPCRKQDGTPVTSADFEVQTIILKGLETLTPSIPIVAEEQDNARDFCALHETYWLVDPIDSTSAFLASRDDFSVNAGLIENGQPVFGIIFAPARDDMVWGEVKAGAWRIKNGHPQKLARMNEDDSRTACARPRLTVSLRDSRLYPIEEWVEKSIVAEVRIQASAYKLAMIAAREADFFLRTSPTYEWDTAAGDAIVRSLGGHLITPQGTPLAYRKDKLENGAFLAFCTNESAARHFLQTTNLNWPWTL